MVAATAELAAFLQRFATRPHPDVPQVESLRSLALGAEAQRAAWLVWGRRLNNELASVVVATRLLRTVEPLGDGALIRAIARLHDDEVHHTQLARSVLEALGGHAPQPQDPPDEPSTDAAEGFVQLVLSALVLGEGVSAARYAAVREHTDNDVARAAIDVLLRDEVQHAELGVRLVPLALALGHEAMGVDALRLFVHGELRQSFRYLDRAVGLDAERRGIPLITRPQPTGNVGVVEPMLDAIAFYRTISARIVPKLEALGVGADAAWTARWSGS